MAYRKKTLRQFKPRTRKYAQAVNEMERALRQLKRWVPVMAEMELWAEEGERTAAVLEKRDIFDPAAELEAKTELP